jgi:hypothetical protein
MSLRGKSSGQSTATRPGLCTIGLPDIIRRNREPCDEEQGFRTFEGPHEDALVITRILYNLSTLAKT